MTAGPHSPAAAVALCLGLTGAASAQSYTPDPGAWRPVAYSDLMFPTGEAKSYASIWQDRLNESNQNSAPKVADGQPLDMSIAVSNRGATEWHFTINFQSKLVVLTVLNTPSICTDEYPSPSAAAKIKVCPMRTRHHRGRSLHRHRWSGLLSGKAGRWAHGRLDSHGHLRGL